MIPMTGIGVVMLVVALVALAAMAQHSGSNDR
jgi:hypothetical protein